MWICFVMYLVLLAGWWIDRKKTLFPNWPDVKKNIFLILFIVTSLAAVIELGRITHDDQVTQVRRNGYGKGSFTEKYQVQVEGEKEQELTIEISPRELTQEEIERYFRQAMEEMDAIVLGENSTPDRVTKPLVLPDSMEGYPFRISWELSRYDVLDLNGNIDEMAMKEAIRRQKEQDESAPDGVLVSLTAALIYKEEQAIYGIDVMLCVEEEEKGIYERILTLINQTESATREEQILTLPASIDGQKIVWSQPVESIVPSLMLVAIMGCILYAVITEEKQKEAKKLRQEEMMKDYPEIISQFTLLMNAGMTVKNIWKKIVEDYERQKRQSGVTRAAYEEMKYTYTEMQSGIPENECYEHFGKRCELPVYIKMGALLSQNLKKGASGTAQMLDMEAKQAMEDRKSRARQLGEEAGTKLLLPMMMMLVVVMIIVVVPAVISIQV